MSSPEVERFEVTQDDLDNEFNPNRRQYRQSKHKATYGIWADEDSDDERPSFGGGGGRHTKDYTAPVSFISGGLKAAEKLPKSTDGDEADTGSDSDDEQAPPPPKYGRKVKGVPGNFDSSRAGVSSFMRAGTSAGKMGIGQWQKHTKGIGLKLMEKMGFQAGKGLGKEGQGIAIPVEAKLRKGRAAIGFYGSERTERSLHDYPTQTDSEEEEEQEFRKKLHQWKKGDGEKVKKKVKYVYRTADELIASGKKSKKTIIQSELAKVKVIDMTGKEKRVLSGYHAIGNRHDKPDDDELFYSDVKEKRAFDMPELLHNLDLLVNMAEEEILNNSRRLTSDKDLVINLRHEKEKLDDVIAQEEKQIKKMQEIFAIVEECEKRMEPEAENPMTLEECAELFQKLQDDYYEEYKIYELAALAVSLVFPLMKKEFEGWEPLTSPKQGLHTIQQWKEILEDPNKQFSQAQGFMEPYEKLVWETWMPHVRSVITQKWSPRNSDPLIEMLEAWMPVLPQWIASNILEQLVLPRLQNEVEEWNPLTDTMPIHSWIHPWLPLMADRLDPLYAPIRHKLANALINWHPSDPSAKMILQPWIGVFQKGHTDAFLVKNIVPKLAMCLQEFIINPHQQLLDPWNWVLSWKEMMPIPVLVTLIEKHFFPKWHQVLTTWLNTNPNYDEVTKWYMGWKSMFPEPLLSHPTIKDQFNKALNIMNRAVTGHYQPGARENVAYLTSTERRGGFEGTPPPPPIPVPPPSQPDPKYEMEGIKTNMASASIPSSFKDLIERRAEERGILYMPIPNKTWEAKQVYRFGRSQMYLDRGVIFMLESDNRWIPTSLNTLIDRST